MPLCFGASGSVRARRMPHSLSAAIDVQTFCPVTTHSSPSRTALVLTPARSDPAPGSEKSWHHSTSPRSMGRRNRSFCASVPWRTIVGPAMPIATEKAPTFTPYRLCSWVKIACCSGVPPRPPNSFGHVMPAQPCSKSVPCHCFCRRVCSSSDMRPPRDPGGKSSGGPLRGACSSSHAPTSARNAASSGVSSKSTDARLEQVLVDRGLSRVATVVGRRIGAGALLDVALGPRLVARQGAVAHRAQEALDRLDDLHRADRREQV